MKIAFYHELHKGGARRGTNEFAKQLKNRGHQVDLYTIDKQDTEKEFYSNMYGFEFHPRTWKGKNWRIRLYKDTVELYKLNELNKKIAEVINKKDYDACYVAASFFLESPFILKHLKPPSFFYCNDPYYRIIYEPDLFQKTGLPFYKLWYEKINRKIREYLDKENIMKANHIIFISKFVGREFKRIYRIGGNAVYYGVDTDFFKPIDTKKEFDIMFIGSRDFMDGYPLFKECLKYLKRRVKVRTVLFEEEWLNDEELLRTYQISKIFIATAFREPLGLDPLEAMSCGVPVVAIKEGGHIETVINGKTGFLTNKNPKIIADKLDLLLSDEMLLKEMSLNSRAHVVKNWSWEKRGEELEQLIKRTLTYEKP